MPFPTGQQLCPGAFPRSISAYLLRRPLTLGTTSSHRETAISLHQIQTSKTGSRVLLRHQCVKLWYLILKSFSFWERYLQSLQKESTTILGVFMVQKFSSICMQDAATSSNCPGNSPASNKGMKTCPVHHSSSI